MAKVTTQYDDAIYRYATQAGIDPGLLKAMLMQESSLNPKAVSRTGVQGLAQVTEATAKDPGMGLRTMDGRKVAPLSDRSDADSSIRFAADYLSALLNRYNGDVAHATTAYNEGFTKVSKWINKGKPSGMIDQEGIDYHKNVNKWLETFKNTGQIPSGGQAPMTKQPTGKIPTAGTTPVPQGLVSAGEFDDFALDYDPALHPLQGDEAASPGEERQFREVFSSAVDVIFGDQMSNLIKIMRSGTTNLGTDNQDPNDPSIKEPWESVSELAYTIADSEAQKLKARGEPVHPSVFFSETGVIPHIVEALWQVGGAAGIIGMDDQDQYAGALINTMRIAGEKMAEEGNEDAMGEAESLFAELGYAAYEDEMQEPKQKPVAEGVSTALLGGNV